MSGVRYAVVELETLDCLGARLVRGLRAGGAGSSCFACEAAVGARRRDGRSVALLLGLVSFEGSFSCFAAEEDVGAVSRDGNCTGFVGSRCTFDVGEVVSACFSCLAAEDAVGAVRCDGNCTGFVVPLGDFEAGEVTGFDFFEAVDGVGFALAVAFCTRSFVLLSTLDLIGWVCFDEEAADCGAGPLDALGEELACKVVEGLMPGEAFGVVTFVWEGLEESAVGGAARVFANVGVSCAVGFGFSFLSVSAGGVVFKMVDV